MSDAWQATRGACVPHGRHDGGQTMASAMRKMAVYLGLVEDDHRYVDPYAGDYGADDDEGYGGEFIDQGDRGDAADRADGADGGGRDLWRGDGSAAANGRAPEREQVPVQTTDLARITTLHPRTYNEARAIGEHFREGTPVIINLTEMVDSDARRLVDFSAGLIFGLRGSIDRVTNKVFLLSPANVEVAAEDKARIAERGFFNQS
jgi:cell division inhibitor SepF